MTIPAKQFACVLSSKGHRNSKNLRQNRETSSSFFRKPPRKKGRKMSKREQVQDKTGTEAKKLKKERSVDEAKTEIINKIIEKVKEIIKDSTEG